jgi:hypothetical protein
MFMTKVLQNKKEIKNLSYAWNEPTDPFLFSV